MGAEPKTIPGPRNWSGCPQQNRVVTHRPSAGTACKASAMRRDKGKFPQRNAATTPAAAKANGRMSLCIESNYSTNRQMQAWHVTQRRCRKCQGWRSLERVYRRAAWWQHDPEPPPSASGQGDSDGSRPECFCTVSFKSKYIKAFCVAVQPWALTGFRGDSFSGNPSKTCPR